MLAVGLALFGFTLCVARRWVSGVALVAGSTAFLAAYLFGTHIGDEGASDPSPGLSAAFAIALVLIAVGLALTGYRRARADTASFGMPPADGRPRAAIGSDV